MTKNKSKVIAGILAILILACTLFYLTNGHSDTINVTYSPNKLSELNLYTDETSAKSLSGWGGLLQGFPVIVKTYLHKKLLVEHDRLSDEKFDIENVTLPDIQKYDLSFPGDTTYKGSPELSIFYDISQADLKRFQELSEAYRSVSTNGEYVITLSNRVLGLGTERPEMLYVLKNANENYCKKINGQLQERNYQIALPTNSEAPNMTPFPRIAKEQEVSSIELINEQAGCFKTENTIYYYQVLFSF